MSTWPVSATLGHTRQASRPKVLLPSRDVCEEEARARRPDNSVSQAPRHATIKRATSVPGTAVDKRGLDLIRPEEAKWQWADQSDTGSPMSVSGFPTCLARS